MSSFNYSFREFKYNILKQIEKICYHTIICSLSTGSYNIFEDNFVQKYTYKDRNIFYLIDAYGNIYDHNKNLIYNNTKFDYKTTILMLQGLLYNKYDPFGFKDEIIEKCVDYLNQKICQKYLSNLERCRKDSIVKIKDCYKFDKINPFIKRCIDISNEYKMVGYLNISNIDYYLKELYKIEVECPIKFD